MSSRNPSIYSLVDPAPYPVDLDDDDDDDNYNGYHPYLQLNNEDHLELPSSPQSISSDSAVGGVPDSNEEEVVAAQGVYETLSDDSDDYFDPSIYLRPSAYSAVPYSNSSSDGGSIDESPGQQSQSQSQSQSLPSSIASPDSDLGSLSVSPSPVSAASPSSLASPGSPGSPDSDSVSGSAADLHLDLDSDLDLDLDSLSGDLVVDHKLTFTACPAVSVRHLIYIPIGDCLEIITTSNLVLLALRPLRIGEAVPAAPVATIWTTFLLTSTATAIATTATTTTTTTSTTTSTNPTDNRDISLPPISILPQTTTYSVKSILTSHPRN
ncbi:hypothetical protein VSDG_08399 [Cytospora chrysosperma]|uniref:Uncharacterized protein n=1 Tax=Cytospora chrysosperma TaxID=252740 RepID=A0A423VG73_CYTCH|nr:hypothetical protein VSDG_08399 [Valsa sordida]